jgi:hypothetical protein
MSTKNREKERMNMKTLNVAHYAGSKIVASDGTQFLIIENGGQLTYMNLDICEINGNWFNSYEELLENFNSTEPKFAYLLRNGTDCPAKKFQDHWYDLWDDSNGNYAYLKTDIDREQMSYYEKEFKKKNRVKRHEDWGEFENRFIDFLRSKGHSVYIINRPWTSLEVRGDR